MVVLCEFHQLLVINDYCWGLSLTSRTISQGLGGGGIALMINIVITDLVPLRERGQYMAMVQMVSAVGAALGPFLGGILTERRSWRWVFYINIPIGGSKSKVVLAYKKS